MSIHPHRDQGKEPVEREDLPPQRRRGQYPKPWKLEYKIPWWWQWGKRTWARCGAYETERSAWQAYVTQVKKQKRSQRKHRWAYRLIGPDGVIDEYRPDLEDGKD